MALLNAFAGRSEQGPAALVIDGEPGIGKSTLWRAGVEQAREKGLRVLSSRPAEAELGLAYAGLSDLFECVLDDVLPALSPPRNSKPSLVLTATPSPAISAGGLAPAPIAISPCAASIGSSRRSPLAVRSSKPLS